MRIEHVALWTDDLDRLTAFYAEYFGATVQPRYINSEKGFESCFMNLAEGARIEVMRTTAFAPVGVEPGAQRIGLTHIAISVGSEDEVDRLTKQLREDGHPIVDGPRRTGDGYYECVVIDPDGNRIEVTV